MSPTTATVTAGGSAVPFTATLTGSTATINWSISPAVGTLSSATGTTTSYTPPATVASQTTVTLTGFVLAQGPNGETVTLQRTGGVANGTGFDFAIQAAPSLQAPANNATGVTTATGFSWTAFSGGVHSVVFDPVVATNPQYYVYTAGTSTTIPDLGAVSASVALPAAATYNWEVTGFAPVASIDAWAGASGPPIANPFTIGNSQRFGFTTQ